MADFRLLGFLDIFKEHSGGNDPLFETPAAKTCQVRYLKMVGEQFFAASKVKMGGGTPGDAEFRKQGFGSGYQVSNCFVFFIVNEDLGRGHSGQLIKDDFRFSLLVHKFSNVKGTGGKVEKADPEERFLSIVAAGERCHIEVILVVEQLRVSDHTGGYHPHDFPADDTLCFTWRFGLLTDGNTTSGLDQFCKISGGGMVGDAAHGDFIGLVFTVS